MKSKIIQEFKSEINNVQLKNKDDFNLIEEVLLQLEHCFRIDIKTSELSDLIIYLALHVFAEFEHNIRYVDNSIDDETVYITLFDFYCDNLVFDRSEDIEKSNNKYKILTNNNKNDNKYQGLTVLDMLYFKTTSTISLHSTDDKLEELLMNKYNTESVTYKQLFDDIRKELSTIEKDTSMDTFYNLDINR
jgi:hypothetical protein